MGLVVENATARIQGTKLQYTGPILITHWDEWACDIKVIGLGARLLYDQLQV